jgi:hypothetical protein
MNLMLTAETVFLYKKIKWALFCQVKIQRTKRKSPAVDIAEAYWQQKGRKCHLKQSLLINYLNNPVLDTRSHLQNDEDGPGTV